mgnify:CR=1 FL=1
MNSIETVAKNIRLEVMQYAFFHLFPVAVAGTAMIMDIRTAKVDNGWIIFSMSVGLFVCIWQKNITGIWIFYNGKRNAVISYDPLCFWDDRCRRY